VSISTILAGAASATLPETAIKYAIDVTLVPETRALKGRVHVRWTNKSPVAIAEVPLHCYLNAFSHEETTWVTSVPAKRRSFLDDVVNAHADPWGYTKLVRVEQIDRGTARPLRWKFIQPDDQNPLDRSLAQASLARPVGPGEELTLVVEFEARLPVPIARTGGKDDFFFVAQWYPKLGVLEVPGVRHASGTRWAARQFHGPTEFYADFADYDVTIHVPAGWKVGATGERASSQGGGVTFRQRAVHDFAFVAGSDLLLRTVEHPLAGTADKVRIEYYLPAGSSDEQFKRWHAAVSGAMDVFSRRVGPYPYRTLTVMMPSWRWRRTGGMEYPTLITGEPADPLFDHFVLRESRLAEGTLIHEFGHQYFYGLLASNEQEEAFLDEGFNTYWHVEVMKELYGSEASAGHVFGRPLRVDQLMALGLDQDRRHVREPVAKRPASLYLDGAWKAQIYMRSVFAFLTAAQLFGQQTVDRLFSRYYQAFRFRHPDLDDFLAIAAEVGGDPLQSLLREAFTQPELPDYRVVSISSKKWRPARGYHQDRSGNLVLIAGKAKEDLADAALDQRAEEKNQTILVEISDGGWRVGDRGVDGRVSRVSRTPFKRASSRATVLVENGRYISEAVVHGSGWMHLPLDIDFHFDDGVTLRDPWDGRSKWRRYRFWRQAKLVAVQLDPQQRIRLDVRPQNNGRRPEVARPFVQDWSSWLGSASDWLTGLLALWL
jgi:hypothetical protein